MALIEHEFTDNGNSAEVIWRGGRAAKGTLKTTANENFGGGTLHVDYKESKAGQFNSVASISDTTKLANFEVASGYIRLRLAGATTPVVGGVVQPH